MGLGWIEICAMRSPEFSTVPASLRPARMVIAGRRFTAAASTAARPLRAASKPGLSCRASLKALRAVGRSPCRYAACPIATT